MYLIDTNIWLERLLEQERSDEVAELLNSISTEKLFITDFSFHMPPCGRKPCFLKQEGDRT